ncbi:hypothetical protein [Cupriavidus sp. H18C2]|uniref:hypothetical protein n=1 Tax=Cupriavidus sp. H18C2 TaxID=3241602 RepID=UPI003BF7C1FC
MPSKVMSAQGNPFVLALMDALGLPKHTRSFVLRCEVGQAVTVQCTYMPQADGVEAFDARPLLAEYKLVPASAVTAGDPAEAFVDEDPGGAVTVVQHINLAPGTDAVAIAQAMRRAKDAAVAGIDAQLGRPVIPQPQPLRGQTAIIPAAASWIGIGAVCAVAAGTYVMGLW